MSATTIAGLTGAALIGLGLYGVLVNVHALRRILAFNLIGSGVFLVFGLVARRGAAAGFAADPVPQAMVITGIVVAFSATALAIGLLLRLQERRAEEAAAPPDATGSGEGAGKGTGEGTGKGTGKGTGERMGKP